MMSVAIEILGSQGYSQRSLAFSSFGKAKKASVENRKKASGEKGGRGGNGPLRFADSLIASLFILAASPLVFFTFPTYYNAKLRWLLNKDKKRN